MHQNRPAGAVLNLSFVVSVSIVVTLSIKLLVAGALCGRYESIKSKGVRVEKREGMPSWVYWGLWGMNSRKVALGFFIVSVILTLIIVPLGIYIQDYIALSIIVVPVWYWLSIKWADDNSAWATTKKP